MQNPCKSDPMTVATQSKGVKQKQTRFLFINMPFGTLRYPSLGLGSLQAVLRSRCFPCSTEHFTFSFAERVGSEYYQCIAEGHPAGVYLGEHVFTKALYGFYPVSEDQFNEWAAARSSSSYTGAMFGSSIAPEALLTKSKKALQEAPLFIQWCYDSVNWSEYDIVGFTNMFQQQLASLALARMIKENHPRTLIVFGGANCEDQMGIELMHQFDFVDVVVNGEAEISFLELAERVEVGKSYADVRGIVSRDPATGDVTGSGSVPVHNLDALPIPDFSDYYCSLIKSGIQEKMETYLVMETSRGCWYGQKRQCTFCGLNGSTMAYRSKGGKRAVDEMLTLIEQYGRRPIQLSDNVLDHQYFHTAIPLLREIAPDLTIYYEVRSSMKKDQIRALSEAGITHLQPGIESFSDEVLGLMNKGVSALQNIQFLKWCRQFGITPYWGFLWGLPGESPEAYGEMAGRIPLLTHLTPPVYAMEIVLTRFSPLFEKAEALGLRDIKADDAYGFIYPFPENVLSRFAYNFAYHFDREVPSEEYTRECIEQIQLWRKEFHTSSLCMVRRGKDILVVDKRPVARRPVTFLEPIYRNVLDLCDSIRLTDEVRTYIASKRPRGMKGTDDILSELLRRGFVMISKDYVLSLVVGTTDECIVINK